MDMQAYRDEIKLKLTGGLLDLEISDAALDGLINASLREVQRYTDSTRLATIPYSRCIDLTGCGISSVSRVYRSQSYMGGDVGDSGSTWSDPMYMAQWQMMSGNGQMYNLSDWTYNYAAWNTALQIRNTISTDLIFRFEKATNKLYINCAFDYPQFITIEYVPIYNNVSEIESDFWIDILIRLAVANAKVTLGRIRSRYSASNALWAQDGERLLEEGTAELNTIREQMRTSSQLCYGID